MSWGDGIGLAPAHRTRCEECGGWNDGGPVDCGCRPCEGCGETVREGRDYCEECEDAIREDAEDARRDLARDMADESREEE